MSLISYGISSLLLLHARCFQQGVDVDSMFISGLPWMGMQAGVWDPGFEPLNHVLMNVANPLGTSIVGAFGADGDYDHIGYSLASSKVAFGLRVFRQRLLFKGTLYTVLTTF